MSRELRRLERARIKRDKLVTPKNLELLELIKRSEAKTSTQPPQPEQEEEIEPDCKTNEHLIADELVVGDGQGDVLFKESEFSGEFNFRDSILDQLDRYWVYLERMKKHDADSYELYKQVGATLVPYATTGINHDLHDYEGMSRMTAEEIKEYKAEIQIPPWFRTHRPAFGCIAVGTDPLHEQHEKDSPKSTLWTPKFMYFVRYEHAPPELQPKRGGDVYKMTVWWDRPEDKKQMKWGRPSEFGVFISNDGESLQVLRQLETKLIPARHKTGHDHTGSLRGRMFDIPQRAWRIPDDYETWARQYGLTAQVHLAHLFCFLLEKYERSNYSMARVTVHKDDLTAVFGIDPRRMAYFFRDRDIVVHNGTRERILHFVRPHMRHDGSAVKAHFRGAREFNWAGYRVRVTIPGLDHELLPEFDLGVSDSYWMEKGEKCYDTKEIGKALTRHLDSKMPLVQALSEMEGKPMTIRSRLSRSRQ